MIARGMIVAGVVACLATMPAPAAGIGRCCFPPPRSFREEAADLNTVVLHGILTNRRTVKGKVLVDLQVHTVVKSAVAYKDVRVHVLEQDVARVGRNDHYLVFFYLDRKKFDAYRGVLFKGNPGAVDYFQKAMARDAKKTVENLVFFSRYLDDAEEEVAKDAFLEVSRASPVDVLRAGPKLPRDKLRHWLKDPKTPLYKRGSFALLLAGCGKAEDARILKALLAHPDVQGADQILAGLVLLDPKEGWKYLQGVLKNPKNSFLFRYGALRAVRILEELSPYPMKKPDLVAAICLLLNQGDIADLAVEQLRRWKCWDQVDRVLAVRGTDGFKLPIVRKAVLRYCLQCRGKPAAVAHVVECRKADRELVSDVEELLKLEQEDEKTVVS
jgi:hypothetical protein